MTDNNQTGKYYYCRKCKNTVFSPEGKNFAFCPKCGAGSECLTEVQPKQTIREESVITDEKTADNQAKPKQKNSKMLLPLVLAAVLIISVAGTAVFLRNRNSASAEHSGKPDNEEIQSDQKESTEAEPVTSIVQPALQAAANYRPVFPAVVSLAENTQITANADNNYEVASDFSNVFNMRDMWMSDREKEALLKNGFYVRNSPYHQWYEFYEKYKENPLYYVPNFITTDSMLHTFHLYYQYLQENVERDYLYDEISTLSGILLENSKKQLEILKGTEWESAAARNVDYFSVAVNLLGGNESLTENAKTEFNAVMRADNTDSSVLFSTEGDEYIQNYIAFKPRGYYEGNEKLEQYFRAMTWFGQMTFLQRAEDLDRSALLLTLAINDDTSRDRFDTVFKVTSFLAGDSDDNLYYEYLPVIESVYGTVNDVSELAKNSDKFSEYHSLTAAMSEPIINSKTLPDASAPDGKSMRGMRVIGQRFSVDSSALDQLMYPELKENNAGERRLLPSAMDVPAVLGSDEALSILKTDTNAFDFQDYESKVDSLRSEILSSTNEEWTASVSSTWLNALRPLLNENREGYPKFMQNNAWKRKTLNTFLGSYTELKHDVTLYQKQPSPQLGADGGPDPTDDRGYVEPEPELFHRLADLSARIVGGLSEFGLISDTDLKYMNRFTYLSSVFENISKKELQNELPTDEEFEVIRKYGDDLYDFWYKTIEEKVKGKDYYVYDYPSALITDIAHSPESNSCLEIAEGYPCEITVLVYFDGKIRAATGVVYSYYEFEQPESEMYTDVTWKQLLFENNAHNYDGLIPARPNWTADFQTDVNKRDVNGAVGYATVLIDNLNIRDSNSTYGDVVGQATTKNKDIAVYAVYDGYDYTWYRIGKDQWIADDNGKWVSFKFLE